MPDRPAVPCTLEFGAETLHLRLPAGTDLLSLPEDPPLADPAAAIQEALRAPIGTPALAEIVRARCAQRADATAVVVVSDNTRPVPYQGPEGILEPILGVLRAEGVRTIEILIATGTHRPLGEAELRKLLPVSVFDSRIRITNHVCTDPAILRTIGRTARGTEVTINSHYLDADIKILTGLVEPHFMAGASGGPKSVCPGVVGEAVTHVFHGPDLMGHARSTSLVLDGNPCHEESLAVAEMAGVDFIVNVTLNGAKRVTGVHAGDVRAAHRKAVDHILRTGAIAIPHEYDLVITHAGFVGINHYQAAKAAVEAAKAVKVGGTMVLAANHTDVDPVGSANYRRVLPQLGTLGVDGFTRRIQEPSWTFIPEQWEVQMWIRAFRMLGAFERLIYCAPQLTGELFRARGIPGQDGGLGLEATSGRDLAERMVQTAIDRHHAHAPNARTAVLLDGPYGVPVRR